MFLYSASFDSEHKAGHDLLNGAIEEVTPNIHIIWFTRGVLVLSVYINELVGLECMLHTLLGGKRVHNTKY